VRGQRELAGLPGSTFTSSFCANSAMTWYSSSTKIIAGEKRHRHDKGACSQVTLVA